MGFCLDFNEIKIFGGAAAPPLPTPVMSMDTVRTEQCSPFVNSILGVENFLPLVAVSYPT